MKWIIIMIAWLLLSFPLATFTGKIIHRNNPDPEEHMKGSDTHADTGKNQVADRK